MSDLHRHRSLGRVVLVGAGPGDPELLTIRALRALERADAVVYDRLVPQEIIDLAPANAHREYVGKRIGEQPASQTTINARLIELAQRYSFIVRLKGGDPFIFGRGFEEVEALHAHGIHYEVIPGVTAALGCAAYAGIPLTHRGAASQLTVVTAQHADGAQAPHWPSLCAPNQTVVFYMGVAEIPTIQQKLLAHGRAATTAVALIENGCTRQQRVFVTTLHALSDEAHRVNLQAPALIIVGDVVSAANAFDNILLRQALTNVVENAA